MDPGLLTLGAIAVGATALLRQFTKPRKEGFEVIPAAGYANTVEKGQELFNRLTLSSDPRSEAIRLDNMSEKDKLAYKTAVDTATSMPSVSYTSGVLNVTQEDTKVPVHIPDKDDILLRAAFCDRATISNAVFKDSQFSADCGICVTKGTTHDNKPFTGPRGMFIFSAEKKAFVEDRDSKGDTFSKAKPTYGYCEGATSGVDHDYSFALDEKEFLPLIERVNCKKNRNLDGGCATCLQDNSFTYVGKTGRSLDAITFTIYGKNAWVDAMTGSVKVDFNPPNKVDRVAVSSTPTTFKVILNEGAFLNFSVSGWDVGGKTNKLVTAEFWGTMSFPNSTGGMEVIPLDRILLKDETTGNLPKYAKDFANVNGIFCRKMVKRSGQDSMILSGQLPFLLVNNSPFEGIDCKGSLLQTMPSSVEKFGGDPCFKPSTQGPGTWTDACIRDRIQTMGCTMDGQLYKNPSSLRQLTMTQMIQKIQEIASKKFSENEQSMKCTGKNISTPCDPYVNFDPEETPELSNQCIEFLYYNRGADKTNIGPTYTGPIGTFYSMDQSGKKIMCLPGAKLDPAVADSATLNMLKSAYRNGFAGAAPGLNAVKKVFDNNYNRAVNASLPSNVASNRGGRKDNIEACFRTLANIPENILPDTKLPNARYCRVRFPPGRAECIQISQLAVFDNRDINVARGKDVKATSKLGNDCGPERAVDGALASRAHPFEFHNQCRANEWWMVDFGKVYPIKRLEYYNRADCCSQRANGMLLELLDENQKIVWSQTLDGTMKQTYYTFVKVHNV
jgi:hypothetical protein